MIISNLSQLARVLYANTRVRKEVESMTHDGWRVMFHSLAGNAHYTKLRHLTNGSFFSIRVDLSSGWMTYMKDCKVVKTERLWQ